MTATKATQAKKWKGMKEGVTCEWTIIAKVIPGHEQALREQAKARAMETSEKAKADEVLGVGTVHDYRWVLFENGTRLMFMSNFDGDWGQYIDDFFAVKAVAEGFDRAFEHCEGYPGISASTNAKKDWMQAHTQEGLIYKRAYLGSVKEMWKAQALQKAFQEVLDHPDAAKALAHPALKPLLAHAAK